MCDKFLMTACNGIGNEWLRIRIFLQICLFIKVFIMITIFQYIILIHKVQKLVFQIYKISNKICMQRYNFKKQSIYFLTT